MRHRCAIAASGLGAAALLAWVVPHASAQASAPDCSVRPADGAAGDFFACALAHDGALAALPALRDDDRGTDSGSVHVFARQGAGWSAAAKLLAADGAAGDQFGFAVALADGRIAVGAPFHDAAGSDAGAAYVFTRGADGSWTQTTKLVPPGLGARDELGRAVAASASLVAAGAPGDDDHGSSAGAVYVFDLAGGPAVKLTADDGGAGDGFGFALALAGDRLLVGAPWDDDGGFQAGAVYVFERQAGAWSQRAKLTAADRRPASLFGGAIALAGSRAAIGARLDDGAGTNAGAAYVFVGAGATWSQEAKLAVPGLDAGDELGTSVALAGDLLLAGARFADLPGAADAGLAHLFARGPEGWVFRETLTAVQPRAGDEFGFALGLAGGRALVGAYRFDAAGADAGTACAYDLGGGSPDLAPADLRIDVTDGLSTAPREATLVYRIRIHDAGPGAAGGAFVVSDLHPALTACTWTCDATDGAACGAAAGTGAIAETVPVLPSGGRLTYRATCRVAAGFTGTLNSKARIVPPAGVTDPDLGNNEERDLTEIDGAPPPADLAVSLTDGVDEVVAGGTVTYVLGVFNGGPGAAAGAHLTDNLPAGLACGAWSCFPAGGAVCGDAAGRVEDPLDDILGLPAAAAVTYAVTCEVPPGLAGTTLAHTATATPPSGVADPFPGNNGATDTTAVLVPPSLVADLAVTKTASATQILIGDSLTYTVTVRNLGPDTAAGARIHDDLPDGLSECVPWTCAAADGAICGTVSGAENPLDEIVSLPVGGSVVYTVTCLALVQGELVNTATATPPESVFDPTPANDAGTVTVVANPIPPPVADLSLAKSDGLAVTVAGQNLVYTLTVANAGPDPAEGVRLLDPAPANLLGADWSCAGDAGSGDLDATFDLAAGESVACTLTGATPQDFCGPLVNTAEIVPPAGTIDPGPGDRVATDTTLVFPEAGPCASKSLADPGPYALGDAVTYQIHLFNGGPGPILDGPGNEFTDPLPPELGGIGAVADSGIVQVILPGILLWNGAIGAGEVVTIVVQATVVAGNPGDVVANQGIFLDPGTGIPTPTDDPATAVPGDPTVFVIAGVLEIPTLVPGALALMALALIAAGLAALRLTAGRRRPGAGPAGRR